jgi:hypothetical protein
MPNKFTIMSELDDILTWLEYDSETATHGEIHIYVQSNSIYVPVFHFEGTYIEN